MDRFQYICRVVIIIIFRLWIGIYVAMPFCILPWDILFISGIVLVVIGEVSNFRLFRQYWKYYGYSAQKFQDICYNLMFIIATISNIVHWDVTKLIITEFLGIGDNP